LQFLYGISGKYILSGQHNYPTVGDRNSQFAARYVGKTPVVFSTDWGFADKDSTDSYLARPEIVKEAIRQHRQGAIVTICWHAVPPTADEPVTFRAAPGSDPQRLATVQGRLLDEQFRDVLTPGTELHERWAAQVDEIAKFLKHLQDAKVPVLWRPYHEMNGDWFWWGGRAGEYGTSDLYKQLYGRLVDHHGIHNLVWVWSVDRAPREELAHAKFFPGHEYVDVLSLDVYGNDFSQDYYDSLVALSRGKPLALGEVGNPPASEILDKQPRWAYYVTWAGMVRNTPKVQYDALLRDERVLGLSDEAYIKSAARYWTSCPAARFLRVVGDERGAEHAGSTRPGVLVAAIGGAAQRRPIHAVEDSRHRVGRVEHDGRRPHARRGGAPIHPLQRPGDHDRDALQRRRDDRDQVDNDFWREHMGLARDVAARRRRPDPGDRTVGRVALGRA
jgi:mannan endo-1,4-beta-mannosidase